VDLATVTIISFAGLASIVGAVGLALRDLFLAPRQVEEAAPRLSRLPLARDAVAPTGLIGRLDQSVERLASESGIPSGGLTVTLLLVFTGLLLGGAVFLWTDDLLAAVVGAIAGMLLPIPVLSYRRNQRLRQVQMQLSDVLDMMSRATRAGESLEQSIALVGQRAAEPLGLEFRRCSRHLQMGLSVGAAMRALVHRLPLMDIRIMATTLSVHRQTGGNLALTLERMARVVRDRMNYRQQMKSVTAAGRFSAMLIAMAGPLLFVFMFAFQREYATKLLTLPLGNVLLIIAVVLELIGLVWISRMIRIEY
jgi:tight adherence protein B